jgi:hypothetical protein
VTLFPLCSHYWVESLLGILLDGICEHELKGGGNLQKANIQVYRGATANGKLSFVNSLHWDYRDKSNKSGTGRMNKLMLKMGGRFLWVTCENENDKRETYIDENASDQYYGFDCEGTFVGFRGHRDLQKCWAIWLPIHGSRCVQVSVRFPQS